MRRQCPLDAKAKTKDSVDTKEPTAEVKSVDLFLASRSMDHVAYLRSFRARSSLRTLDFERQGERAPLRRPFLPFLHSWTSWITSSSNPPSTLGRIITAVGPTTLGRIIHHMSEEAMGEAERSMGHDQRSEGQKIDDSSSQAHESDEHRIMHTPSPITSCGAVLSPVISLSPFVHSVGGWVDPAVLSCLVLSCRV